MASSIIFGPQIGIIAGIANYIISKYIAKDDGPVWFQLNHAISHLKISISAVPKMILSNSIAGASILALSVYFYPVAAMALNNQRVYSSFVRSVIITPVFEEILYRGVLQEKIHNIINYAQLKVESSVKKIFAIVIQAFLVAVKCFSNLDSLVEFPFLFGMGFSLGYLKEVTFDMWTPISFRVLLSGVICARVAILGC